MSKKKNYEVAPDGGQWKVKGHGNKRASKKFDTQKQAIDYGKKQAKKNKSELYIKNRKGRIRDANSYDKDPYPPKG
ncbi:MAG: DUF2188 domain-containing protein [Bacteroidota bacterium]